MIKMVWLLRRPAETTRADFHKWWLEVHAALAQQYPGIRRYVVSLAQDATPVEGFDNDTWVDGLPLQAPWDGLAEMWFDDEPAARAALSKSLGEDVRADARAHIAERMRLITVEHVMIDSQPVP